MTIRSSIAGIFSLFFFLGWLSLLPATMGSTINEPDAGHTRDSTEWVTVGVVAFSGNTRTRPEVLARELMFSEGDTIRLDELHGLIGESRRNMLNTQLFNFVDYEIVTDELSQISVHFSLVERWYTWPIPILEIKERNLTDWIGSPSTRRMNYGISLDLGNITGRNDQVHLIFRTGYRHAYVLLYHSPWLNPSRTLLWSMEAGMEKSRESAYLTQKNKQLFFKDNKFIERKQFIQGALTFRPGIYVRHRFHVGFTEYAYADTLTILNPRFVPGERSRFQFMNLGYDFVLDRRDSRAYPLQGSYLIASIRRLGMGLFETERMDVSVVQGSFRHYLDLAPRWYSGGSLILKYSEGSTLSYFNQQGLGFANNLVRGYENYVVDAQSFLVLKTNLKYELIPQKNTHLAFIPTEKFAHIHYALYLNLFADAGYTFDKYFYRHNPLSNKILAGVGVGLDFVTYYDRVYRLECSMNRHGETGIYFHVLAPF